MPRGWRLGVIAALALAVLVTFFIVRGSRSRAEQMGARAAATAAVPTSLVQVGRARRVFRQETLTAYGTVEFSPEHAEVVDLEAERIVTRVFVAVGQAVHQGQPLLTVTTTPNDRLELERARIDVVFAQRTVARLRDLRARQLATNAQVQSAEADLAKAEAVLESVVKRLGDRLDVTLTAPMDGVVQAVNVRQGDVAAPHTPLVRLARGDRLQVRLGVEPEDLDRVRVGQKVRVTPVQGRTAPVTGAITHVYREVDPQRRLTPVVVPLPAPTTLLPGMVVRAEIVLHERANVLVVPRSAVLYRGPRAYVFLVTEGHAVRRWVDVGADDGRDVEVLDSLHPGDPVVTLGNHELTDGMAVRLEPSGG